MFVRLCHKPRGVYLQCRLASEEEGMLEELKERVHYTCGSSVTTIKAAGVYTD